MKKIIPLTVAIVLSFNAYCQAQLKTRTFVISDFTEKIMKVVLSGNEMMDASLREQVQAVWNISPYEFCTQQEFEAQKKNEDYYFLTVVDRQRQRETEPGVKMLCLYKGSQKAEEGVDGMYKVVTVPFCPTEDENYRQSTFLPVILNILQLQVIEIMEKRFNPTGLVRTDSRWQNGGWGRTIVIAEEDLSKHPDSIVRYGFDNLEIADRNTIDSLVASRAKYTMIGYVVAPLNPQKGSLYYTMLIDAQSWSLAYFEWHLYSPRQDVGFSINEIKSIVAKNNRK